MPNYGQIINEQKHKPPIDLADMHLPFAWLVFRALAVSDTNIWGAHPRRDLGVKAFNNNHGVRIKDYDGNTARYCRDDNPEVTLELSGFRPGDSDPPQPRIVRTGKSRIIQAVERTDRNHTSFVVPVSGSIDYQVEDYQTESHALELAHKQMASLTVGGQIKVVTVEATLGIEESQTTTDSSERGQSESKSLSAAYGPIGLPPGKALEITATRELVGAKLVIEGVAHPEFSINFGIHHRGRWKNHKGSRRHAHWASKEEMLRVFEGKGERNLDHAIAFRNKPVEGWLLRPMMQPVSGTEYRIEQDFDDPAAESSLTYREV